MGLVRVLAELAVLFVACFLSFAIGVGIAVHHIRGASADVTLEKIEHRKRSA